jgi:hypothetical protein
MAKGRENHIWPPLPDQPKDFRQGVTNASTSKVNDFHALGHIIQIDGLTEVKHGQCQIEPGAIQMPEQGDNDPLRATAAE